MTMMRRNQMPFSKSVPSANKSPLIKAQAHQTEEDDQEPSDTNRTTTRKVEIKKASERYNLSSFSYWTGKDMYDTTQARVQAMRAAADPDDDAIMEELANLSKDLDRYNQSVKDKKLHLDELISQGCEGEVEIVVYDPAIFRKRHHSSQSTTSHSPRVLRKRQKVFRNTREEEAAPPAIQSRRQTKGLKRTEKKAASTLDEDTQSASKQSQRTESSPAPPSDSLFTTPNIDLKELKVLSFGHWGPKILRRTKGSSGIHPYGHLYTHVSSKPRQNQSLGELLLSFPTHTEIIKDVTPDESKYITTFAKFLTSHQFDWGKALGSSVCNILFCWAHAMPPARVIGDDGSMGADIARLTRICNHHEMINLLKTAPRLLQLAIHNQFFTVDSIHSELVEESTHVPWKERNGFFKALHAMACRTDDKLQWTSEPGIQSRLKTAYLTINQIALDCIRNLSYNTPHVNVKIKTSGEHAVPLDMVDLSKGIGWVYQQIMVRGNGQGDEGHEVKKFYKHGMEWLQWRYLIVLIGVMLIYKRDMYNQKFDQYLLEKKRTKTEIKNMKKQLKDATCLNQLSHNWVTLHPERAIKPSNDKNDAMVKVTQDDMRVKAVRDASELRSEALRALSLFLLYGTSGLFHVWPAQLFYGHPWSHLDNHMMTLLSQFVSDKGIFRKDLDWPGMTVYTPAQSRTPGGLEAPHVFFEGKNKLPVLSFKTKDVHDILTVSTGEADDDEWSEKREKASHRKGKGKAKA
ncbi:uncharacterized protein MELLADRAFT_85624 [Melampsora larici-populina 98AG31]|uniref:Uncharacterized protein n=1 Tax=Melampsora larici-populina (strain 98AG31 / pathotype 3-4-7) TaxID=747676 RepID=F4RJ78_MELLP|nr:uncharacterized protein MELLADRAFT_85624 [Melampsora larici-populina 98AG31]EGG07550.1 hypothetical protein MELLADRAFT_85624 [Melampsora larici-populina 98AG31]